MRQATHSQGAEMDAHPSREVARHYRRADLGGEILAALRAVGRDPEALGPDDLAAVEEFHVGGREATVALVSQLDLHPDEVVLDVGCGIGGTARYIASTYGCRVRGVDLTDAYVAVGTDLTARMGLADQVRLEQADALALPFPDGSFDAATLLHVGMNVEDKHGLFTEVRRVLRRGGRCGVYDQMRLTSGEPRYPVPWAATRATSHLAAPHEYVASLAAAGFEVLALRNRRDFALDFYRKVQEAAEASGRPPLGLHVLMGEAAFDARMPNMVRALTEGLIAPVEVIARSR